MDRIFKLNEYNILTLKYNVIFSSIVRVGGGSDQPSEWIKINLSHGGMVLWQM